MLFTPSLLMAGGATLLLIAIDKTLDEFGIHWLGTAIKIALPIIGMAAGVYFLEHNALVWWILK